MTVFEVGFGEDTFPEEFTIFLASFLFMKFQGLIWLKNNKFEVSWTMSSLQSHNNLADDFVSRSFHMGQLKPVYVYIIFGSIFESVHIIFGRNSVT